MAFKAGLARAMGLTERETEIFRELSTPEKVQDFVTDIPINMEPHGDTCYSARLALRHNAAHCIEGGFVAALALMLHGRPALFMNLSAKGDDDHIIALFKRGRHWGGISKTNHIWLRWRDAIYASPRELAMSYFHEYLTGPRKSLRRASHPFDIGAYDPVYWATSEDNCWAMNNEILAAPHFSLVTAAQSKMLKRRDPFEDYFNSMREWIADGDNISGRRWPVPQIENTPKK